MKTPLVMILHKPSDLRMHRVQDPHPVLIDIMIVSRPSIPTLASYQQLNWKLTFSSS